MNNDSLRYIDADFFLQVPNFFFRCLSFFTSTTWHHPATVWLGGTRARERTIPIEAWWTLTGGQRRRPAHVQTQTDLLVSGEMKKEISLPYCHKRDVKRHVKAHVASSRRSSGLANQAYNLLIEHSLWLPGLRLYLGITLFRLLILLLFYPANTQNLSLQH